MHVYTDGTTWVVAHSLREAEVVAYGGEDSGDGPLELIPDDDNLTITDDDPTDDNEEGTETHTCREWADSFDEPGILSTTED